ncbi:MAG: type II secretion system minor pseudopilin GspI [Pacificimonas sp.]
MRVETPKSRQDGFTLIEILVALAVLGLSAAALIGAAEAHTARIYGLESRAAALWAAERHLAELQIGAMPLSDGVRRMRMGNRDWQVTTDDAATDDPDIARAEIRVSAETDGTQYARLVGFVDLARGDAVR